MAGDTRIIKTGLFGKKNKDILDSVIGQWSDGIWENNPQMAKYWKFANVTMPNGEAIIEIDNRSSNGHHYNGFTGLDDAKVKEIFGRYVKAIVKQELSDGLNGEWKRNCTSECDYLTRSNDEPITVKDAYYAYEMLKGRNVSKHPEYSEQFYAQDEDGKDYQIEIELEDGPSAEDPEKLTVVLSGERKTVDVPKGGTDDHYKKAIAAGLKELGKYKLMEGKISDTSEGKYPKFVQTKKPLSYKAFKQQTAKALCDIYDYRYGPADLLTDGDYKGIVWKCFDAGRSPEDAAKELAEADDMWNPAKSPREKAVRGANGWKNGADASEATKKCEDTDGWEGWDDIADLEPALEKIEQLTYELHSCVRGAYSNCSTWSELSDYIKSLANDLEAAGDNVSWKNDKEND